MPQRSDYPDATKIGNALISLLERTGRPMRPLETYGPLAKNFDLSAKQLAARLPDGKRPYWHNVVQNARKVLVKAGRLRAFPKRIWALPDKNTTSKLVRVESADELRACIDSFNDGLSRNRELAHELARETTYWVVDPSTGAFGPSKFCGFAGMTFSAYARARAGGATGARFDGTVARRAIERATGVRFRRDTELTADLSHWAAKHFGKNAMARVDKGKWRFLVLPAEVAERRSATKAARGRVGVKYRPAVEDPRLANRDPFAVDPEKMERGTRGHAITQNALAKHLESQGIKPLSPGSTDPEFDVAWRHAGTLYVAEVKSITDANKEKQLRCVFRSTRTSVPADPDRSERSDGFDRSERSDGGGQFWFLSSGG